MIADDALIYQVYDNEYFGVEVLAKTIYQFGFFADDFT